MNAVDRLHQELGLQIGLVIFHDTCAVQSRRYWPEAMIAKARAKRELHRSAVRAIRRRITRLCK